MKKVLEVKNITKIYNVYKNNFDRLREIFTKKSHHKEFISNKDISFELFEGETLGIIGTNGAGKSTLLKIISGVTEASSGEVLRHGKVTALLELGTGFNEQLNGFENISLNGTLIGMTQKDVEQNRQNIIDFSELGDYIYEPIMTYSSGMKMRLAFSIALFSEPQILIVDEALSVGDAHFGAKCTKALRERKEKNMSIIYVSHDLNSLKLLCDRVILLNRGEMIEQGEPEDVINRYNFLISKLNDTQENMSYKSDNNNSYGSFDIEIKKVTITGEKSLSSLIPSGQNATISIEILSKKEFKNITVGILIKDRYGQDIFGTNSYHHHKKIDTKEDQEYLCTFTMPLNIGTGEYSITAALHLDENHLEECYHWLDYATEFKVAGIEGDMFIGLNRLQPTINFTQKKRDDTDKQ